MIVYTDSLEGIAPDQLQGFFVGWPNPPDAATHLKLLHGSYRVILALDGRQVVGFINAISDGVLTAYIPLLEVLPSHQRQGIGRELVRCMLAMLGGLYAIDLLCDMELQTFYAQFEMRPAQGMMMRNYARQSGAQAEK